MGWLLRRQRAKSLGRSGWIAVMQPQVNDARQVMDGVSQSARQAVQLAAARGKRKASHAILLPVSPRAGGLNAKPYARVPHRCGQQTLRSSRRSSTDAGGHPRSACGTPTISLAVFSQCFWVHRSRPNIRPNRSCSDVPASCKAFAAKVSLPEGVGSAAACSSVRVQRT